jgi:hypothetical protein
MLIAKQKDIIFATKAGGTVLCVLYPKVHRIGVEMKKGKTNTTQLEVN